MDVFNIQKNIATESNEVKDSDLILLTPTRLIRYYKACCILNCRVWVYTDDPTRRVAYHPWCRRYLYLIQKRWRKKVRLEKLKKITRVLKRTFNPYINYSDFILLIYKFL
jgi:hypothetical protein